jgi:outer membrane protein W
MRLTVTALTALALTTFFAAPAFAQDAAAPAPTDTAQSETKATSKKGPGFELGARLGFALPFGKTMDDASKDMSDAVTGTIPIMLDAGYRITPNWYVGGYGQFGYGIVNSDACPSGESCGIQSYRIGANVHYHIMPDQTFDPWIGVGTGYEWLHVSESKGSNSRTGTLGGFELVNLQLGGDYQLSPNASIGPFASFSIGQYANASTAVNGTDAPGSTSIEKTALHEWLTFGFRGSFNL